MPKSHADFPCTMVVQVPCELRVAMKALGRIRGAGSVYAGATRECMQRGLAIIKDEMFPEDLAQFERIYKNIATTEGIELDIDQLVEEAMNDG